MVTIKGYNISLPYGDSFTLKFTLTDKASGEPYILPEGSILRFAVQYRMSSSALMEKTAGPEEQDSDGSVTFSFSSDDTKIDRDSYRYTLAVVSPDANKCVTLIGFQDDAVFAVEKDCPSSGASLIQPEIEVSTELTGERLPDYEGSYIFEPSLSTDIVIPTARKSVAENITLKKASPRNLFTFSATGLFMYPADVVIPDNVTSLSGNSIRGFKEHAEIKSITFGGTSAVTEIPTQAFVSCSGVEYIELPASITRIAGYAFSGCSSLKTIVFNSVPVIDYMSPSAANPFNYCTSLEDLQIPPDWTTNLYISAGTYSFTNVLTHDSMVAMIANLHDYTGGTAHTITLGATNLARLSAEEKAVAASKNWTLA